MINNDEAVLITRTPYRFSLYGGGLDYPEWYKDTEYGATVLCAGLDYYCYQTLRILPPFFEHKYRVAYSLIETSDDLDKINHPTVRECFRAYGKDRSLELGHVGDLPARSGIGSSSAFTVGLINSLCALDGIYLGKAALAVAAVELEQGPAMEQVGFQDQCAAAFGGLVLIEADRSGVRPRRFVCRQEYTEYIQSSLLLGFDGQERLSSVASTEVKDKIRRGLSEDKLIELKDISDTGIRAFADEADITKHAQLTKEARDIKLELNGDRKNNRIQDLIETTERAGSLCTKPIGAGGGGFFACWAPRYRHNKIRESVRIKTWVEVRFSNTGSQVIFRE